MKNCKRPFFGNCGSDSSLKLICASNRISLPWLSFGKWRFFGKYGSPPNLLLYKVVGVLESVICEVGTSVCCNISLNGVKSLGSSKSFVMPINILQFVIDVHSSCIPRFDCCKTYPIVVNTRTCVKTSEFRIHNSEERNRVLCHHIGLLSTRAFPTGVRLSF